MSNYFYLTVIIFLIVFSSCKKEDSTIQTSPPSDLLGNWYDSVKTNNETVVLKLNLDEHSGQLHGDGNFKFFQIVNSSQIDISFQNSVAGNFTTPDVNIVLKSLDNKVEFNGKISTDKLKLSGILLVTLKGNFYIKDSTYNFNLSLIKK